MKIQQKVGLILLFVLLITSFIVWRILDQKRVVSISTPASALLIAINRCDGIADKSVAHLTAQVEFQKLEIAGRRVRVLQNCMNDLGFVENPAWVKYAEPIAQKNALTQQISFNEAYENLRRKNMLIAAPKQSVPLYWLGKSAK
ncbi:MAG TPA: hypothetical protein PL131_01665 [Methylotenera sp.]|nr:hypothetical protein [Methylotenera sp.]HPH04553.1 hypothetical protein [Methylotenera sp.]HPN00773.1 hypothetical protein [Methylotenera sp.]